FLNQFSAADIRQSSTTHLEKLRQKPSQSIAEFTGKFRELANQTGYNDTAKKEMFRSRLAPWIQELVDDAIAEPDDYNDFVQWIIKLAQRRELRDAGNKGGHNISATGPYSGPSPRPGGRFQPGQPRNQNAGNSGFLPRNQGNSYPQRQGTPNSESRRCYFCGKIGHIARDCRVNPQRNDPRRSNGPYRPPGRFGQQRIAATDRGDDLAHAGHSLRDDNRWSRPGVQEALVQAEEERPQANQYGRTNVSNTSWRPTGGTWREYEDVHVPSRSNGSDADNWRVNIDQLGKGLA